MLYIVAFACGFQRRSRSGDVPLYATSSTKDPGIGKIAESLALTSSEGENVYSVSWCAYIKCYTHIMALK